MSTATQKQNLFQTGNEPIDEPMPIEQPVLGTNQKPEIEQEQFEDWDKEKAIEGYKSLQRKNNQLDLTVKQLAEEKIRAEERAKVLEEIATQRPIKPEAPKEEPAPQKPAKPVRPIGYNKADAIAYPESESGRYEQALDTYYEQKEVYDEWKEQQILTQVSTVARSFEEQKNLELQANEYAQRKAAHISRLAKATNGDVEKASKVFDFVQKAMAQDDPTWFISLYDSANANNQQTNMKTQQALARNERQGTYQPVGTIQSPNNNTGDDAENFMKEISARKGNKHDLFKTVKNH